MRTMYPQFTWSVQGEAIVFRGKIRVKPEFSEYSLEIKYEKGCSPKVYVKNPQLVPNAPHVYPSDRRLCLYHPDNFKWSDDKLVAKEIMQWTQAWLYFYECWLDTGNWYGPEAPHGGAKSEIPSDK